MFSAILILFMVVGYQAQIPGTGPCREINGTPDFDPKKYLGEWYIFAGTWIEKPMGKCRRIEYIPVDDSATTIFEAVQLIVPGPLPIGEDVIKIRYLGDANYLVINSTDINLVDRTVTIWNTDYASFAIRGICVNVGQSSLYFAWILTRSQHPPPNVISKIDEALKFDGVPMEYFRREDQMGCPKNCN